MLCNTASSVLGFMVGLVKLANFGAKQRIVFVIHSLAKYQIYRFKTPKVHKIESIE